MVAREIETVDEHERAEWARLGELLESGDAAPAQRHARREGLRERNAALVERIREGFGDAGPDRAALLFHLRQTVADKLEVARPPRRRE
jgi:hypothetical protein